jgi:hypothetical protein
MLTLGLDHIWYPNQRSQELLAEAKRLHMVQEALQAGQPKSIKSLHIRERIRKLLGTLSIRIEERNNVRPQADLPAHQQNSSCR